MLKVIAFFRRKQGLSVEDFQSYWRSNHAAIVAKLPGLRRYVQSHTLLSGYKAHRPIYDGIAELWYDDTQAMRAVAKTPEYQAVRADEPNFIDVSTMGNIVTEEHVIKEGAVLPQGVKNVGFVSHKPDMAIADFQRYWLEVHGPLAAKISVLRRYVQCHTWKSMYESGRKPPYDGVALTWFDDTSAMRASAASPEYARLIADEPKFLLLPSPILITTEHVIVS